MCLSNYVHIHLVSSVLVVISTDMYVATYLAMILYFLSGQNNDYWSTASSHMLPIDYCMVNELMK